MYIFSLYIVGRLGAAYADSDLHPILIFFIKFNFKNLLEMYIFSLYIVGTGDKWKNLNLLLGKKMVMVKRYLRS